VQDVAFDVGQFVDGKVLLDDVGQELGGLPDVDAVATAVDRRRLSSSRTAATSEFGSRRRTDGRRATCAAPAADSLPWPISSVSVHTLRMVRPWRPVAGLPTPFSGTYGTGTSERDRSRTTATGQAEW
jgi:hypothetical protein